MTFAKNTALLLFSIILSPATAFAQDKVDEVKDKASQKAENRIDTRIDQGLDKGLNAVEGLFSKKKKKKSTPQTKNSDTAKTSETTPTSTAVPTSNNSAEEVVSGVAAVPINLDFVGAYSIEINTIKNGKDQGTTSMDFHFNKNTWVMETSDHEEHMRIIMDYDTYSMITLIDDAKKKKTGIKLKMPKSFLTAIEDDAETESATQREFKRTGKTKVIEGNICHEYIGETEDGSFEAWVDEKSDINMAKQFSAFNPKGKNKNWDSGVYQGLTMESTWRSTNGKEIVHMNTRNVQVGSVNAAKFGTTGYEVMDMTNLPGLGGQ